MELNCENIEIYYNYISLCLNLEKEMGDLQVAVTLLGLIAIVLLVVFAACHFLGLWTWTAAWLYSTREEKIGLTRSKGHYNANGYLVCVSIELYYSISVYLKYVHLFNNAILIHGYK